MQKTGRENRMKRQLMAEQWDSFARAVLPKDAPAVQRQEMRRAFYAGAQGMLYGVIAAFAPESEPTDEDLQMMANLEIELSEFAEWC
jgi:biotin synthase-like enzyme